MNEFYVNKRKDDDGDNEVHQQGCYWLSLAGNTEYLGMFSNCVGAVAEARRRGYNANGCKHCSPECHTS